ncbi:MAG: YlbF family regulator [Clostridia bacterium]|nr:YlbF family regulator [Clostridia bacterium]
MDKEKIFEKAKELGELIAHSDIKKRADEANRALTADAEAVDLISGYNEKRQEKLEAFADKQPTAEEAQEVNEFLQAEFNKIAENATIREYIEANRDLESVLNQMDQIIKSSLSGGHSCGGSCSSCSGCH